MNKKTALEAEVDLLERKIDMKEKEKLSLFVLLNATKNELNNINMDLDVKVVFGKSLKSKNNLH
jgi:hypothetical protein